ncbi:Fe-S cluster domain-containing protein, DUF3786 [Desulfonema limicola]|uniref:Fe-S cluster domain-containing protein, DUF3786 n=1 Tax=Desulfonema limicola TaxID=45656 RepID=A0A975GEG9_9BACT|nr:DUF3786 domain-containing protein [Desulfonema limicola]QTA78207.1 Fe-S cluster domain-containing protein, DUF3786 [Desulfonema limicola]
MALSVVDLYKDVLPKTNCKDCGFPTCLAFASMVVSAKLGLKNCPHIAYELVEKYQKELDEQHAAGKWIKKDMAQDALVWAKERAASMKIQDLPERIGGELIGKGEDAALKLPYFNDFILIRNLTITKEQGEALNRWEQVFVYNHMAQGGKSLPTGKWKSLQEFPNTISKIKSMRSHVEEPLVNKFAGHVEELAKASKALGGIDMTDKNPSSDLAFYFKVLPRIPVMLMFWDKDMEDSFEAKAKLLFDETIIEHLDIESILFLSERLRQLICGDEDQAK